MSVGAGESTQYSNQADYRAYSHPLNLTIGLDSGRTYRTRYRAAFSTSEKPHPPPLTEGLGGLVPEGRRQKAFSRR
ncbi:hypothetical protein E5S67_04014 [Microcoleus sp. IPMA8]|uniref:Uncharacterized protein n=1 Tax=Microcoleus asticus IPMA8 TaxID=2563858 RepID=A0ABX2D0S2_9CYAN|nr:hypothetical protein [Microcoleus asticus IPMA8]